MSAGWRHFKLNDDKTKAMCQICHLKLVCLCGTSMKSHLNAVNSKLLFGYVKNPHYNS